MRARASSVKPGEAVVDARGMIGRIYLAGEHTSWVILLTDLNSRIPVTIAPRQHPGDHDRRQHRACRAWTRCRTAVTLHDGDQVVTSGDGGLLPPGLPIGTVVGDGQAASASRFWPMPPPAEDVEILDFSQAAGNRRPRHAQPAAGRSRRPQAAGAAAACAASPLPLPRATPPAKRRTPLPPPKPRTPAPRGRPTPVEPDDVDR